MTKYFVIIASVFALALTVWAQTTLSPEEIVKQKKAIIEKCATNLSITQKEIEDILVKRLPPDTKNEYCFVGCILNIRGIVTSKNEISAEQGIELVKLTTAMANNDISTKELPKKIKIFEVCSEGGPGKDYCDIAERFINCVMEKKKEFGVTTKVW